MAFDSYIYYIYTAINICCKNYVLLLQDLKLCREISAAKPNLSNIFILKAHHSRFRLKELIEEIPEFNF